jgi:hypothetical protein
MTRVVNVPGAFLRGSMRLLWISIVLGSAAADCNRDRLAPAHATDGVH